jgi:hypothetical protein
MEAANGERPGRDSQSLALPLTSLDLKLDFIPATVRVKRGPALQEMASSNDRAVGGTRCMESQADCHLLSVAAPEVWTTLPMIFHPLRRFRRSCMDPYLSSLWFLLPHPSQHQRLCWTEAWLLVSSVSFLQTLPTFLGLLLGIPDFLSVFHD